MERTEIRRRFVTVRDMKRIEVEVGKKGGLPAISRRLDLLRPKLFVP